MSRKYVPSFLKNQQNSFAVGEDTAMQNSNELVMGSENMVGGSKTYRPLVNTSLPAKQAPKLVPATLAALTAAGGDSVKTNSSYGDKFSRQFMDGEPVPAKPSTLNITSENEFPTLGAAPSDKQKGPWGQPNKKFADLAKAWARKQEDEEEAERIRIAEEERWKRENSMFSKGVMIMRFNRKKKDDSDDEDVPDYNPTYEEDDQPEEDSYESSSHEEQENEGAGDENEEDEFNENIGREGRRHDDLY
jgi:hypothetical protein